MVEWTDTQICILIDERRDRNEEYHNLGKNRIRFWDSIATKINRDHDTSFNGHQCKEKFMILVRDYNEIEEHEEAERGAQYFNEFRTHFWERPEDDFDRIRNMNSSNRRQRRIGGNNSPAPSTGEVEHVLDQVSGGNRRSRRTSVESRRSQRTSVESRRSRRSQRRTASPPLSRDDTNTNTNNPNVVNPEQNISNHPPPIETSSLRPPPPPYSRSEDNTMTQRVAPIGPASEATYGAQNNNQRSAHANSASNISEEPTRQNSSQNESDVSMHDAM